MGRLKPDSASDTALLIARSVLLAADVAGHAPLLAVGEVAAVRGFLGERAERGWFAFAARRGWSRRWLMAAERVLLRGIFVHYLARKRWIEGMARRALGEDGAKQVVVIGAGYDALGWRLCDEDAALRCFELDHPATQRAKRAAPGSAECFHLLPCDLAVELPEAALLASCARVAGSRGRVIFSFMEKEADGTLGFRGESSWIGRWLRWRQEPFRWGCERAVLDGFLEPLGLRVCALADHEILRREILNPRGAGALPLARGECLCVCESMSPSVKPSPLPFPVAVQATRGRSIQPQDHADEREIC